MIGQNNSPETVPSKHEVAHRELGILSEAVAELEGLAMKISGGPPTQPETNVETPSLSAFLSTVASRVMDQRERIRRAVDEINGLLF